LMADSGLFGTSQARLRHFQCPYLPGCIVVPIYAYKCSSCGHEQDVLQKMSDPLLTVCPECKQDTYSKQVTAAGFQLKGSGWYVTDFRNNSGKSGGGSAERSSSGSTSSSGSSAPSTSTAGSSSTAST